MIQYNWDDILIVGDSFCAHRDEKCTWPQIATTMLTHLPYSAGRIPRGKGWPGGSWWAYRDTLISEMAISVPKVLVIFHTEPYRLPNRNNLGINFRSVESDSSLPSKVASAASGYYTELFCEKFYDWANARWYEELEQLTAQIETVIHIHCFSATTHHVFKKGVTITYPTSDYVDKSKSFLIFRSKVINHYSVEGNRLLAHSIVDLVNNYPGDGAELNIKLVKYANN